MNKYQIYFVDKNGYGGSTIWEGKNITEINKKLKYYINAWQLKPIRDLQIIEIKKG